MEQNQLSPNDGDAYAYQKHSLSLEWTITLKSMNTSLSSTHLLGTEKVVFVIEYLRNLKIATLSCAHTLDRPDVKSLVGLFEEDSGDNSPNFSNSFIFGRCVLFLPISHVPGPPRLYLCELLIALCNNEHNSMMPIGAHPGLVLLALNYRL